ncbi:MAG: hypothetical protein EKK63_11685 [Acinetobacter sp.]|uniref:hypothetical protein n=1 Tax=Acinetobacter sp. TaxID=472 RepID=UPI000FA3F319|nr:hypothetical protein [Acinetobacter sp.]RUP38686.1 MAG: hypothetical protein EKK63_11685 [Acinetobacter sp.]
MNVFSLVSHIQLTETKQQKVNELVAQCVLSACAKTPNMREVLKGDMRNTIYASRLRKVS